MPNQFIFALSIFLAVFVHGATFLFLPQNKKMVSIGAIDKGKGGLKIGFSGSVAGNGLPIAAIDPSLVTIEPSLSVPMTEMVPPPPVVKAVAKPVSKAIDITEVVAIPRTATPPTVKNKKIIKASKKIITHSKKIKVIKQKKTKIVKAKKIKIQKKSHSKQALAKATSTNKNVNGTGQGNNLNSATTALGKGSSDVGGGITKGVIKRYHHVIQAWLAKHKRYPKIARRRNQQGVVILYFKIDSSGEVLKHVIRKTSGHSILDREVSAMLKRATPLPSIPKILAKKSIEFSIPIAFSINSR